jgi:hypothetical protein
VSVSSTPLLSAGAMRGARGGLVRRLRGHETAAQVAIASFLWATLLGPALHLIDHRADHTHGPGSAPHRHTEPARDARANLPSQPAAGDPTERPGPSAPGVPHGADAALHFGLASLEGVQPIGLPPPRAKAELSPRLPTSAAPRPPRDPAHRTRGPPARTAALA